jgi:hypothetical protein
MRKVTVMLPSDLIEQAIRASGMGLTPTLRRRLAVRALWRPRAALNLG